MLDYRTIDFCHPELARDPGAIGANGIATVAATLSQ